MFFCDIIKQRGNGGNQFDMNKNITINANVVTNSIDDGTVKIKMATIGERNDNGMIIETKDSILFGNSEYPLFFNHHHDLDNLIGTFTPLAPDGNDLVANATISDDKVLKMVKSGAIHNASITYTMTDYHYDKDLDAIVVVSADLVELSLVINPADKTAQILNALKEENGMNDEQNKEIIDAIVKAKDELKESIGEQFKGIEDLITETVKKAINGDDDTTDTKDTDIEKLATDVKNFMTKESNSELAKLKEKWGNI